ncbi:endoglycoceramidase-like [Watersipora subatra]|uniref:endoglycoceramidase-like n=1 Tax=Watersipora subatra TaxID=2589382 RepID=UPI00355AD0E6
MLGSPCFLCIFFWVYQLAFAHVQQPIMQDVTIPLSKMKVDNSKSGHPLVDEYGRVRVFHGINRVEKGFPWYPEVLLNSTRIDLLTNWGFNVIRLGTMWAGVEIAPFQVNETYLDMLETIIVSLGKKGVYVILDMHQDGLSSRFGSYDGVPLWLIDSLPPPIKHFPWPFHSTPSNWEFNYVTFACGEAFKNIYTNQSRALDHLGFFWQTVAKRFGRYKNVLGYEIINEPFPGNVYTDPTLFIPGHAGSTELMPMYDKIVPFIRAVDKESLIFYEPVTWGMIFHGRELGSGFTHVPGGDDYRNVSVFSLHYYCWFAGVDDPNPFPFWMRELCDRIFFPDVLSTVHKDISDTGGACFLTEFGQCQATAPKNSTEYQECLNVLKSAEGAMLSWTYWDSVFFQPDGSTIGDTVSLFSRPYAMVIAGQPTSTSYDRHSGEFSLSYKPAEDLSQRTLIYASRVQYPKGFTVSVVNAAYTVSSVYVQASALNFSIPVSIQLRHAV